jgi:hypothetical protein
MVDLAAPLYRERHITSALAVRLRQGIPQRVRFAELSERLQTLGDRIIVLHERTRERPAMFNRRDRVSIKLWRLVEASAEGPLGIISLLAVLAVLAAGSALAWW